jgi:hypothetical protein
MPVFIHCQRNVKKLRHNAQLRQTQLIFFPGIDIGVAEIEQWTEILLQQSFNARRGAWTAAAMQDYVRLNF